MISLSDICDLLNKLLDFINMAKISSTILHLNNYIVLNIQNNYHSRIYKSIIRGSARYKPVKTTIYYSLFINHSLRMNMRIDTYKTTNINNILSNIFNNYYSTIFT